MRDIMCLGLARSDASEHFGFLGHFLATDNPTSSAITRERFGWTPAQLSLLEDLDQPYYFGINNVA
ncbi:MAG: hypothetical protein ABI852_12665 [Gemmatimonadaceae bacterium]